MPGGSLGDLLRCDEVFDKLKTVDVMKVLFAILKVRTAKWGQDPLP